MSDTITLPVSAGIKRNSPWALIVRSKDGTTPFEGTTFTGKAFHSRHDPEDEVITVAVDADEKAGTPPRLILSLAESVCATITHGLVTVVLEADGTELGEMIVPVTGRAS